MTCAATTEGSFNVTLKNLQRKETLITGENASTGQYSKAKVTGGTVNSVYMQTQLSSSGSAVSAYTEVPRNSRYYYINYTDKIGAGTGLKVVGYQKNVNSKTASGYIYI